jgi:hypothetical protein
VRRRRLATLLKRINRANNNVNNTRTRATAAITTREVKTSIPHVSPKQHNETTFSSQTTRRLKPPTQNNKRMLRTFTTRVVAAAVHQSQTQARRHFAVITATSDAHLAETIAKSDSKLVVVDWTVGAHVTVPVLRLSAHTKQSSRPFCNSISTGFVVRPVPPRRARVRAPL